MKILRIPDGDGGSAAATLEKPASTPAVVAPSPNAKPAAAPAATPPPEKEPVVDNTQSDDPFEIKKPVTAAKPADKPAATAKPEFDPTKAAPKELRTAYETTKAEAKALSDKVKDYERKIAEFDSKGKDSSALTERLNAIEKERDAALAELRAHKQEATPEFIKQYEEPLKQAAEDARREVLQLQVNNADGTTRNATWDDFVEIYSMPTGKAIEKADELFGKASNFVQGLRRDLLNMQAKKDRALQEEKAQFKERTTREIAQQAQKRDHVGKLWAETNKRLGESVADYKDDPEDTEAMEARKHALSVFDSKIEGADEQDFINKKINRDAHIRQRVGAYAVTKLKLSRANQEIESLKKQVEELKGSAPGKTNRPGGATVETSEDDWAKGLVEAVEGK